MKKNWIIAILIFIVAELSAQTAVEERIDSLKSRMITANTDSSIAKIYHELSRSYEEINSDSAAVYIAKGLAWAQRNNLVFFEAQALIETGRLHSILGDLPKALTYYNRGLTIAKKNNYPGLLATAKFFMANMYKGIEDYERSLSLFKETFAIDIQSAGDEWPVSGIALSKAFVRVNQFDSARYYLNLIRDRMVKEGIAMQINATSELAEAYYLLQEFDSAKVYYNKLLPFTQAAGDKRRTCLYAYGFASVFHDMGELDSAQYYAQISFDLAKEINFQRQKFWAGSMLAELSEEKDPNKALEYYKTAMLAKDKILGANSINALNAIEEQDREAKRKLDEAQSRLRQITLAAIASLLLLIAGGLFYSFRRQRKSNRQLLLQKKKIETTLQQLKDTQSQLIQSEKMASLGELTAGIAHEIQNPLNFVNNFSEVNRELIAEIKEEIGKGNFDQVKIIAGDLDANQEKINQHGKRADAIVKSMLQHSRTSSGKEEPADINALCDEYLRLAYHGMRARDKSFNVDIKTEFDPDLPKIRIVPQDIGRVILNLLNNAFQAINAKTQNFASQHHIPTVKVTTKNFGDKIEIRISDNGAGIPEEIKDKIFQPFFTTRPTGKGTGLGLSLAYDIVKAHGGELSVESIEGAGTTFRILLPLV